jgi:DNA-binding transcriptional regulator YiaG
LTDFVNVGKKISNHRKRLQMTQDDLAYQLFVTRQLVSTCQSRHGVSFYEWENNENVIQILFE